MNRQIQSLRDGTDFSDGRTASSTVFMPNRRPGTDRENLSRDASHGAGQCLGEETYAAIGSYDDAELNEKLLQFLANRRG